MSKTKEDLILQGINLLIMFHPDIAEKFKKDFNLEYVDMYPIEQEPTVPEKTDKSMNRVIKVGEDCPRCGVIGVCDEKLEHHNSGRCIPKSKTKGVLGK